MCRLLLLPLSLVLLTAGCDASGELAARRSVAAERPRDAVEARIVGLRAELDRAVQRAISE